MKVLRELGVDLIPFELPEFPVENISFILWAEAAAAFDELTRSGQDELMVRQIQRAWPNVFRASRFIPAVEYIQANRARHILIQKMAEQMKAVDLFRDIFLRREQPSCYQSDGASLRGGA